MYPSCRGACLLPRDPVVEQTKSWSCHGQCQSMTQPCNGTCPGSLVLDCSTGTCRPMFEVSHHLCRGNCASKRDKCDGQCFRDVPKPGVVKQFSMAECPHHPDSCYLPQMSCNHFALGQLKGWGCPDLAEHSREHCERAETSAYGSVSRVNTSYDGMPSSDMMAISVAWPWRPTARGIDPGAACPTANSATGSTTA